MDAAVCESSVDLGALGLEDVDFAALGLTLDELKLALDMAMDPACEPADLAGSIPGPDTFNAALDAALLDYACYTPNGDTTYNPLISDVSAAGSDTHNTASDDDV